MADLNGDEADETVRRGTLPRWDPVVRTVHWGVALVIVLNGFVTEGGENVHVALGLTALTLLGLRIVWGFVGPENARFAAFPPSVARVSTHLSEIFGGRRRGRRSHDGLGSLMAYALWACLAGVTLTGATMEFGPPAPAAAEAQEIEREEAEEREEGEEDREREEGEGGETETEHWLEETHETLATLLLVLAGVHVAGVTFESMRLRRNLVKPMIDGERPEPVED